MLQDIVIIGGGASGLMLAAGLDLRGRRGMILEKTARCGTKLLMSGGGRCNITHGGSIKEFPAAYGAAGPRIRRCLYRHSNLELAKWLVDNGIGLADEHGRELDEYDLQDCGRVFPASMRASDILELLLRKAAANGWEVRTGSDVYDICRIPSGGSSDDEGAAVWDVAVSPADHIRTGIIVMATGGITMPETGSDGSAAEILRGLGLCITPMRSALAPVYVEDYPYEELSGISLSDVTVMVTSPDTDGQRKEKAACMTGSLLFTHRGFSGPVILDISRYAGQGRLLRIKYNKEYDSLPKRLQRALSLRAEGPSGDVRTNTLASLLDSDDFIISSVDRNGMVTAGGISLDEIDTRTMEIKRFTGAYSVCRMYAVGEALDIDGRTGGYNLQMCWSTAQTAADSIRTVFSDK